jgi:hypothetical protein
MGLISVSEMDTEHLKNALLKALRLYYVRANFKDMTLTQFFEAVDNPMDGEIEMLSKELTQR